MGKLLHLIRAGRHVDRRGTAVDLSAGDLALIAKNYNRERHEAPIVIGHPSSDSPAYGWIESLTAEGDGLYATPREVNPQFAELVRQGAYKKISAALYPPDSPQNPAPGAWSLRHVGFLGGEVPAVKGLKQAEFAENDVTFVELELSENFDREVVSFFRRMREFLIEKFGRESADEAIPDWTIEFLSREAEDPSSSDFNETLHEETNMDEKELAARQAELDRRQAELDERDAELSERSATLAAQARETAQAAAAEFTEGLVKAGRLLPRFRAGVVELLTELDDGEQRQVEFSESDTAAASAKVSTGVFLRKLLEAQPVSVELGELAREDGKVPEAGNSIELAEAAKNYQAEMKAKGVEITTRQAWAHVKQGQ